MTELWERDAVDIADAVRAGQLQARGVLEVFVERIERLDGPLNSICDIDVPSARSQAREVDAIVARGDDPGLFAGVPIGIKELAAAKGLSYTHGSSLYAGEIADHDCIEVARLRAAGAVIVAKTASPEFGSINWTRTNVHGTTNNPWKLECTPGGSSGGSAAAVAAGLFPICSGSDGGGSIRIPSSYSGLFGYKMTFGLSGSAPEGFDTSLTAVPGPMCRSVLDAARYADVITGPTNHDPTSLPKPDLFEPRLLTGVPIENLHGKRVAWSSTLGHAVCDPEVARVTHAAALQLCTDAGFELLDVDVRIANPARAWGILSGFDMAAWYGERAEGRLDELTPVVRAGIAYTQRVTPNDVLRSLRRRSEMLLAIGELFDQVDYLLTPTTATVAFAAGGPPPRVIDGAAAGGMGSVPFTAPFNISGQPAVSIPVGCSADGLPIGVQVVGRRHDDIGVLACGALVERNRPWSKFAPYAYPR